MFLARYLLYFLVTVHPIIFPSGPGPSHIKADFYFTGPCSDQFTGVRRFQLKIGEQTIGIRSLEILRGSGYLALTPGNTPSKNSTAESWNVELKNDQGRATLRSFHRAMEDGITLRRMSVELEDCRIDLRGRISQP